MKSHSRRSWGLVFLTLGACSDPAQPFGEPAPFSDRPTLTLEAPGPDTAFGPGDLYAFRLVASAPIAAERVSLALDKASVDAEICAPDGLGVLACRLTLEEAFFTPEEDVQAELRATFTPEASEPVQASTELRLDARPPRAVNVELSQDRLGLGGMTRLSVAFDEPVDATRPPGLSWRDGRDPGFGALRAEGALWVAELQAAEGTPEGEFVLEQIEATDRVGNVGSSEVARGIFVDLSPPVITDLVVSPELANDAQRVEAQFRVVESNLDGVSASLAGAAMDCAEAAPGRWTCGLRPLRPSPATQGPAALRVVARDRVGQTTDETRTLTLDFVAPSLVTAEVELVPNQANPLRDVSAARAGTSIIVRALYDEALGELPRLIATASTGASVELTPQTPADEVRTAVVYSVVVDAALADGTYDLVFRALDRVGNQGMDQAPGFVVDGTVDPLLIDQSEVSYVRSPIGNGSPEAREDATGQPSFTVPSGPYFGLSPADGLDAEEIVAASAFALADGTRPTRLRVWADAEADFLLSTVEPDAGGAWRRADLELPPLDIDRIYVSGLDGAGNESVPVLIENAWYVATSGRPVSGDSPHEFSTSVVEAPPLAESLDPLSGEELEALDAQTLDVEPMPHWRTHFSEDSGSASALEVALDRGRGVVVGLGQRVSGTWEFTGRSWRFIGSPLGPFPRDDTAMAYDAARSMVLVFGGRDLFITSDPVDDFWSYDGQSWTLLPPGPRPPARVGHAMAYAPSDHSLILFGGRDEDGVFDDTWRWDGSSWTDVTPSQASGRPTPRSEHGMGFDPVSGELLIFGGADPGGALLSDTWAWDGQSWRQVGQAGPVPPARADMAMAEDPTSGRLRLFGGVVSGRDPMVWTWDGSAWSSSAPADPLQEPSFGRLRAVPDPEGRGLLLVGEAPAQTTRLQDGAWADVAPLPTAFPAQYVGGSLEWSGARGEVFVVGGQTNFEPLYDWDGTSSDFVTGLFGRPVRSATSFDSNRERLLILSEQSPTRSLPARTFEWSELTGLSSDLSPGGPTPDFRLEMAYDRLRQETVAYTEFGETWTWDGMSWTQASPVGGSPPRRLDFGLAYDVSRGVTVLFGGFSDGAALDEVWEWDGATWTEVTPPPGTGPGPRRDPAVAYDPTEGKILIAGGSSGLVGLSDVWAWDGTSWAEIEIADVEGPPQLMQDLARDELRDRLVLLAGNGLWEVAEAERPAVQMLTRFPSALLDAASGLRARAACGHNPASAGARLVAWETGGAPSPGTVGQAGAWVELGRTTQTLPLAAAGDGLIDFVGLSPERVESLSLQGNGIALQCRLVGAGGGATNEIGADYLELRLRYDAGAL